jgi:tetratricopeptide (TPR) repeat protein
MAALEISKSRDVEYAAGLALGFSGNLSQAEGLADKLEKRYPEDTFVKFTYAPVLRAVTAVGHSKGAEAVERLETTLHYELAGNGLNVNHWYLGGLHSAYVRGEAFAAMGKYAEAAGEFQKVLNHRGIVGLDPIGALANLQLGRVLVLSRQFDQAKPAYETFFDMWKDADSDVPILKYARTEYAKL